MYVLWNLCMCYGMHRLVFVMHLVALFWHSNDVFIGAHMETIEKFKKIYVSDHEYVVNLDPSVKTLIFGARIDIHDAVRYI